MPHPHADYVVGISSTCLHTSNSCLYSGCVPSSCPPSPELDTDPCAVFQVDLKHVEHFISVVGAFEDQIFQKRARLLQRQKQRRERDKANKPHQQGQGQGQAGSKWKAAVPNASFTASLQPVGNHQSGLYYLATRSYQSLHLQGCMLHVSANIWLCSLLNTIHCKGTKQVCLRHVVDRHVVAMSFTL